MRRPRHNGLCNFSQFTALVSGGDESRIQLQGVVSTVSKGEAEGERYPGPGDGGAPEEQCRARWFFTVCCSVWFHLIALSFPLQA